MSHGKTDGIHHYEGEIQATIDFGFDGIKLDGCGEFRNLTVFAELMNKTGRPILVEDCHWGTHTRALLRIVAKAQPRACGQVETAQETGATAPRRGWCRGCQT